MTEAETIAPAEVADSRLVREILDDLEHLVPGIASPVFVRRDARPPTNSRSTVTLWLLDGKRVELAVWEPCATPLVGPDDELALYLATGDRKAQGVSAGPRPFGT